MKEIEIPLPNPEDVHDFERLLEEAYLACGLRVSLKATLKKFPGSIHWHLKKGTDSGTLEVTLWTNHHKAWFSIQSGRMAPWINEKLSPLLNSITSHRGKK